MDLGHYARTLRDKGKLSFFTLRTLISPKEEFECPVCYYRGPLMDVNPTTGRRKHAKCPRCGALERHRLQHLALADVLSNKNISTMSLLHFAPEPFFRRYFASRFGTYTTADLEMKNVEYKVDIRNLPFQNASYDLVFASIVLDYVSDDENALTEIRRVLRPEGIAILPVSVVCEKTIEYDKPCPGESYHIRASGMDYFDRYEKHFSRVVKITSHCYPQKYQLFIYEDRSRWPNEQCPLRPPMPGEKHVDVVPVCYV